MHNSVMLIDMDLLEDILKQAGLKSRVIGHRSFSSSASIQFPCSKSIGFHVVTQGQAYIHCESQKQCLALKKGDVALMARGQNHVVSTEQKLTGKLTALSEFDRFNPADSKAKLTLVSGAYQFWNDPLHPFFHEIPDWYILKYEDVQAFDSLQMMLSLLAKEVAQPKLGSDRAVHGILDVLFSYIIRHIVEKKAEKQKSWSHAVQDTEIRKAIEILHSDVSKNWSLEQLAKKVGLSRAGFAQKFKKSMGDTPLHYLTTLRIQRAMQLLSNTEDNVETVALAVGYQDAFGFSKAFKKLTGLPPREFRAKDLKERETGWRI